MAPTSNNSGSRKFLNRLFVGSIIFVELLITLFLGYLFFHVSGIYTFVSLALILIWFGVIVGYLAWAVYFYNINLGLTENDWDKITAQKQQADEDRLIGVEPNTSGSIEEPTQNPYLDQTFGLPPGTVRGVIALTLLFCAIGMLVYSMGTNDSIATQSFRDSLEFFKTAFLMMIAFYFGSRSLDALKERWKKEEPTRTGTPGTSDKTSDGLADTKINANKPQVTIEEPKSANVSSEAAPVATLTSFKSALNADKNSAISKASASDVVLVKNFPHLQDEKHIQLLSDNDIEEIAKANQLEKAAVKAVVQVETGGKGFLADGRPKILFEGHIFWNELKKVGINPEQHAAAHPDILYPHWVKTFYLGGAGEYTRLEKAKLINEDAALKSASWGLFQIMGFNHAIAGSPTVKEFVEKQFESEYNHLNAFINFISYKSAGQKENTLELLRKKDWAGFAFRYNGPKYKENQYDKKLQAAYDRFSKEFMV